MLNRLIHIVEVGPRRVPVAGALPERKRVDEQDVDAAVDGVGGAVVELVPRVGGADLDARRQLALDRVDLVGQLRAREVAPVQRLGADGHGVDLVGVLGGYRGDGREVVVEGLFDVGPKGDGLAGSGRLLDGLY